MLIFGLILGLNIGLKKPFFMVKEKRVIFETL